MCTLKSTLLAATAGLALLTTNLYADSDMRPGGKLDNQLPVKVGGLPLAFAPNVGQDHEAIQFSSRNFGYGIFFTRQETILVFSGEKGKGGTILRLKVAGANPDPIVSGAEELPAKTNYLLGSDPAKWHTGVKDYAKVLYKQVLPGIDLIYYGRDRKLEYDFRVRPHADPKAIRMLLEGKEWSARIAASGDLEISSTGSSVEFAKPVAYQIAADGSRRSVEARYVLKTPTSFGFHLGRYDHSRELVIDPVLVYGTWYGGLNWNTFANGLAVDSLGNAYIAGWTSSPNLPTTTGSFFIENGGAVSTSPNPPPRIGGSSQTGFFAKFDSTGTTLLYATYMGGSTVANAGFDQANAIAVDSNFNIYVTGSTTSTDFPLKNPVQTICSPQGSPVFSACVAFGTNDAFMMKLDPTGSNLIYSTYLGGSGDDAGAGIAVDAAGDAFMVGSTLSVASSGGGFGYPTTASAYLTTPVAGGPLPVAFQYGILTKLGPNGQFLYSTYIGPAAGATGGFASNTSWASSIALDGSNSNVAYITGGTTDSGFPTTANVVKPTCSACSNNHSDAWVAKLNTSVSGSAGLIYSTFLGGSAANDYANGIAIDTSGNAYVTGNTNNNFSPFLTDFPTTPGALMTSPASTSQHAFVTKLNPTASQLVYSTLLGGSNTTQAGYSNSIAVDASGSAAVTGQAVGGLSFGLVNPLPNGGGFLNACAGSCGYLVRLAPDGSAALLSTFFGWFGTWATSLAIDGSGDIWLAGGGSGGLPTTPGAYQTSNLTCSGGICASDAFVAKINSGAGNLVIVKRTVGGDGKFNFTGTGAGIPVSFSITTSGNTGSYPAITNLAAGSTYSIAETLQTGWDLTASSCTNGTLSAITIVAGQTTTCTFTNTQRGSIVVTKATNPNPDPTSSNFNFSATGLSPSPFSLKNGGTQTFTNLVPGSGYSVSETTPNNGQTGWAMTGLTCASALATSSSTISGSSASITVGAGDTVTCRYTNATARTQVTKSFNGGAIPAGASFSFQLRTGASATAAGTILETETFTSTTPGGTILFTSLLIPAQVYEMCEQMMPGWLTTLGPPLYSVFNPGGDNSVVCTNFTPAAGNTVQFAVNNLPPPGGLALAGGFWKNWASCANNNGNQKPVLDQVLATFPIAAGQTTPGVYIGNLYVNTCAIAEDILKRVTGNGTKESNDPSYSLAAQLIAAKLSVQAGAGWTACVATDISSANNLLNPVTDSAGNKGVDFATAFNNNTAPTLTSSQTALANYMQTQLNYFNNNQAVQCPPAFIY